MSSFVTQHLKTKYRPKNKEIDFFEGCPHHGHIYKREIKRDNLLC